MRRVYDSINRRPSVKNADVRLRRFRFGIASQASEKGEEASTRHENLGQVGSAWALRTRNPHHRGFRRWAVLGWNQ
jgi:hypothetical protein